MSMNESIPLAAERLCSHCRKEAARPGQWYCASCHAKYMGHFRRYKEVRQLKQTIATLTTELQFMKRFGTLRVFYTPDQRDASKDLGGRVVGFLPDGRVSVLAEGQTIIARIDELVPDQDVDGRAWEKEEKDHQRC
jgi:hypothetical protein